MEQKAIAQASQREGQRVRVVAPIRMFERHAVPLDARLVQELIEAESFSFYDIATLAKRVELFDEPVDVAVPLQQAPVEPTDVGVVAVRVVIAPLCPTHLVAHKQHRRPRSQ